MSKKPTTPEDVHPRMQEFAESMASVIEADLPGGWGFLLQIAWSIKTDQVFTVTNITAENIPDVMQGFIDAQDDKLPMVHAISEYDNTVITAMETYGGSFVKQLAMLFRLADGQNYQKLRRTFSRYWDQYVDFPKNQKTTQIRKLKKGEDPL